MTYKLNPAIGKIVSPVVLIFPDGTIAEYRDGKELVDAVFDRRYVVNSIRARDNTVEIKLIEPEMPDQSFF